MSLQMRPDLGVPLGVSPWRRSLDVVVAGALLLVVLPLLAVAAGLLLATSGRPVLFHQLRVGEAGRPFRLTKLRTMRPGAGSAVTTRDDVRITRLGRVLRRTSVDELPQLWAVLRGRMTLVGPRPESVELAARYPASARPVLLARPGLTGPAQLAYRERAATPPPGQDPEAWYLETVVPLRAEADLAYLRRPTPTATLAWLVRTALFVVGLGNYEMSVAGSPGRTVSGSQRALTHSPVVRSNSKL
jgi:lipopolysaccharide/colanic/teichoic acid biosynthesis glycosyltransferase